MMELEMKAMPVIRVIGREGSTTDGAGFIQRLWADANAHFQEIAHLAARDERENLLGLWGAMSDCSRAFLPWEDGFTRGLYLAGTQAVNGAEAPDGWTIWTIPAYEYACIHEGGVQGFTRGLAMLRERGLTLVGAAHDFIDPVTGGEYVYLPVRKL